MKNILFLLSWLTAASLFAQDDPGLSFIPGNNPSTELNTNVLLPSFQPQFTPVIQGSGAIAEQITPDIQTLAANLQYDPMRIFNFVHDQIKYVHYFGSLKGAELTLLERSGNDFDQCALLSALLQASGYSPGYQFGYLQMPYDSSDHQDVHHWLGLSVQNTNFNGTTLNYFNYLLGSRGFYGPWGHFTGDTNTLILPRIWINLAVSGTNYYLDPAFKVSEPVSGINLGSAMGLNVTNLTNSAGGTDTGYSVSGLNEAGVRSALQSCNSNLITYLSNNPNASVAQIIGGQQIVPSNGSPLKTSLLFPIFTNSTFLLVNWTNQPTNFMSSFSVSFGGTNQTWFTPQLEGQRISLTFSTNGLGQLWLDDSLALQTTNLGTSNLIHVVLTAQHPYGGWNGTLNIPVDTGLYDQTNNTALYQRTNSSYAIMYAFEASSEWLKSRQQKLDAYRAAGLADTSRQVTTETLNVMGLGWMVQTELSHDLLSQEWGQLPHNHHRFGRMGQEKSHGYYVDVYLQRSATFPSTGYDAPDQVANSQVFDVSSYVWSAMEHGIIEQLQNSNLVAASTIKMLQLANTNSQTVYMASSANWTTGANIRGNLTNYNSGTLGALDGLMSQGFVVLLPKNGSNHVAGASSWAGNGYVELGVSGGLRTMGMIISGGYNGGYISDFGADINVPFIIDSGEIQPDFFDVQSASASILFGADPVNLADGSFQISSTDLSVGQTEPRGFSFSRYYSSARRSSNPAGIAPGWLHNYYCTAAATSDSEAALATATVQQMSPMIVATYAAINLYNNVTLDPRNWEVTALIAKWGIDQTINNAVSVNLGNKTVQFVKQPDGSFTPPANSMLSLLQTNGAYWMQERHGRMFKFGSTGLLTNIVDQYGQTIKFSYNSNSFVTNIVDWKGRSLVLKYAGGTVLTNVSDSTGRSVSYGYTGTDLTSYTDPEQKTYAFAYDTNHEVIATYDALNRLVVTNFYDGNGHIATQLTQGDTNKIWQVFASGYQTVEIDPAGGEQIYTYDSKARLISVQDGMGNITQTVYDGQDHLIETVSPLGETNQSIYDGNNNLIETIDPLGFSNVLTFDSQNRMISAKDADGHVSHFGYNAQFDVTGSTNGNGDYTVMSYNADGTLASRQDSGGTTSYGYDGNGQLNSITNAGGLGTESFINNAFGDPTSHTDVRGFTTTFAYNNRRELTNTVAPTNVTSSVRFDVNANVLTTTDARGFVTSNNWSVTRQLLSTTMPATPQGTPITTSVYDSRDWLVSAQNPLGKTTYFTNDASHRLIAKIDPLIRTSTFSYDGDGRQTGLADPALHLTSQTWDARGKLIHTLDAATNTVGKVYDGAGDLIYLTNRNNNVWHFQYDGANRLTNTISPLSHSSSQVYNNRGLLQSSTDPMSQISTFGYDARGRMTSRTDIVGTNNYTYDGNNNLTLLTNVGTGTKLSWGYDAYNHLASFTNAAGYVLQYRYDANGNLTNLVYPGNRTVAYFYDSNNRLTNLVDWSGRQTAYAYDLAGQLTAITRPNNTVRSMNYDDAGQLTNIVEQTTAKFPITFYKLHYDAAGRSDWEFKGPLPHAFTPPIRSMTYDADNRLASFNGTNVTLDADGNLTYGPITNNAFGTYTYDARNELTTAGGIANGYDPAGNRTSFTNGSTVNSFIVDPQHSEVLMRISNGTTNYYIYGKGLVYEIDETATTTTTAFYHFDSRGSTIALTDASGNPTDEIEYSPYGTITYRSGTNNTPFLYNGRFGVMTDPNGLLYMRARYYNPYLSRFINPDPSGFSGGLNFFAFANGDPISLIDPFGLGAIGQNSGTSLWNTVNTYGSAIIPGTGAYNNAYTSLQNGDYLNAAGWTINGVGDQLLFVLSLGTSSAFTSTVNSTVTTTTSTIETSGTTIATADSGPASSALNGAMLQQQLAAEEAAGTQLPNTLTGFTRHGLNQAISNDGVGVSSQAILDAWQNPLSITGQSGGRFVMQGQNATIVVNSQGKVITTWANSSAGWRITP